MKKKFKKRMQVELLLKRLEWMLQCFIRPGWHFRTKRTKNGTEGFPLWKRCCFFFVFVFFALLLFGYIRSLVKHCSTSPLPGGSDTHLMSPLAPMGNCCHLAILKVKISVSSAVNVIEGRGVSEGCGWVIGVYVCVFYSFQMSSLRSLTDRYIK